MRWVSLATAFFVTLAAAGCGKSRAQVETDYKTKLVALGWQDVQVVGPVVAMEYTFWAKSGGLNFHLQVGGDNYYVGVYPAEGARSSAYYGYGSFKWESGREIVWRPSEPDVLPKVPLGTEGVERARSLARELVETFKACR